MQRDSCIVYELQPVNLGANPNYSYVVRRAHGELLKCSASSDWYAPTFLKRFKDELLAFADTVLVVPRSRLFQDSVSTAQDYTTNDIAVLDDAPVARLMSLMYNMFLNNVMNGLIRMSALRRTGLVETYHDGDVVLTAHLALLGKFRLIDERLNYRGMELGTATSMLNRAGVLQHYYPKLSQSTLFQITTCQTGWVRMVLAAPLTFGERLRALQFIAKRCYWERKRFLDKDLRGAWYYFTRGSWPDRAFIDGG